MKNFRVCNHNLNHWVERKFTHACDVVDFIARGNFERFEIEWENPLYKNEYTTIVEKDENDHLIFNCNFKIPKTFYKLFDI